MSAAFGTSPSSLVKTELKKSLSRPFILSGSLFTAQHYPAILAEITFYSEGRGRGLIANF
jgi:hypothetical protein